MASRRKLKKTIHFVSSELITDIYFRCLMSKEVDEDRVAKVAAEIMEMNNAFILRVNHPDGKKNPVLVKAYFRKLYADWQLAMGKTIKEIASI